MSSEKLTTYLYIALLYRLPLRQVLVMLISCARSKTLNLLRLALLPVVDAQGPRHQCQSKSSHSRASSHVVGISYGSNNRAPS